MGRKDRRRFRQFLQPYHELSGNPFHGTSGIRQGCIEPGSEGLFPMQDHKSAFFLGDNEKINWTTSTTRPEHGKEVENKFDYGITAGAGLEVSTGIGHFLLEGRYYMGLSDFYKNSKRDFFERSAHSFIGIRLSYLIDITK